MAESLVEPFLECIIAPSVTNAARDIFKRKKNLRIVVIGKNYYQASISLKSAAGGYLIQKKTMIKENGKFRSCYRTEPTKEQLDAMKLGWTLVRYVKSNAIAYANHEQLLGVGAGQMSRIDSIKIGIRKVNEAGLNLDGSILASDAFFPFVIA